MEDEVVDFAFYGHEHCDGGHLNNQTNECEYEEQKSKSSDDKQGETDTKKDDDEKSPLKSLRDESNPRKKSHCTDDTRLDIQAEMLKALVDNALPHGTISKIAKKYGRDRSKIKRIWN